MLSAVDMLEMIKQLKMNRGDKLMFSTREFQPIEKNSVWVNKKVFESVQVIGEYYVNNFQGKCQFKGVFFSSKEFSDVFHVMSKQDFLEKYRPKKVFEYYWEYVSTLFEDVEGLKAMQSFNGFSIYSKKMTEEEAQEFEVNHKIHLIKIEDTKTERASR